MIWSSGTGAAGALMGVVIGTWMSSPRKKYRIDGKPTSFPYRGQKRWHTILGLVFGIAAVTWAFSGMMSLDHFRACSPHRAAAAMASGPAPVFPRRCVDV